MFNRFRRSSSRAPATVRAPRLDEVLGTLQPCAGVTGWFTTLPLDGGVVTIGIAGGEEPCPALVEHAREVAQSFPAFRERMARFLDEEARRMAPWAPEIAQLRLELIDLCWPSRPDDGMIYFSGPDEFRCWRCDYVGRQPRSLGFDD